LKTGHTSFFYYEISYETPHKHCIIHTMLCMGSAGVPPARLRAKSPPKFGANFFVF
jgi:hypothetical protein